MYTRTYNICKDIFENINKVDINDNDKRNFRMLTGKDIRGGYLCILENFSNVYLKENFGFKSKEKSPLAYPNGYDRFLDFIGIKGTQNIFKTLNMYKEQLPNNFIPIGNVDGGNLLCQNKDNGYIYIWIHDRDEANCVFLVNYSLVDFLQSIEKLPANKKEDLGIIRERFSNKFLQALKGENKEN